MKKHILSILIILLCTLTACTDTAQVKKQGFFFDTMINITVDEKDLSAAEEGFSLCNELEAVFSRTKKGSELWRINHKENVTLSDDMKEVLEFSFLISEMTDGAFDVTVAPLIDLWDVKNRTAPPSAAEIEKELENVGYSKVSPDSLAASEATIDLGAVAKGYAADRVAALMRQKGVESAIIDLGGNVILIGEYTVGIRNPFDTESLYLRIKLKDKSAVTSGDYQRYFEHNGVRYHHIIDPRTGQCADSGIASVTVIAPSSMQADALSTAIFVSGKEALSLCDRFPDTDALLIMENGDILSSDGFEEKYSLEYLNR